MEKAILKTLAYADIFDYPLNLREIHKWLIGPPSLKLRRVKSKVTLRQIEKAVGELVQSAKCKVQSEYYFLPRRNKLAAKRWRREKQSAIYFRKAKILSQILKLIPWIKLVGISGGLAINNAGKKDDIDLFIITRKNRLWISRLMALGLLSLTGQRRKKGEMGRKIAGKVCINVLLEEDRLEQQHKDIFVAHEVLQMRPLWYRGRIYEQYLSDNQWVFKYLPNWVGPPDLSLRGVKRRSNLPHQIGRLPRSAEADLAMTGIENLAKWLQLKIMQEPRGKERIEDGAVYFHPEDCRSRVLTEYRTRLKKFCLM